MTREGKIFYVEQSQNLKKRVSSYFNKIHDTAKTNVLVKEDCNYKTHRRHHRNRCAFIGKQPA
jgi:excinuclease UvrABC nuclease subunit